MISRELFVGIGLIIGLFVGFGIGFSYPIASETTSQTSDMKTFQQMMLNDSDSMQEMILSTMKDSDQMTMMEDMMKIMMNKMKDDPELKQAMIEHMDRMKASKEIMIGTMDNMDNQMMDGMMKDSTMSFNPDVPITIPMIDGYYNGETVYFIHTELSDKKMANMMTSMVNFPTLYVPDLENIPDEGIGKFYVFTNGIVGTGPYGGGPFFFQIDIFDSVPGQDEYSEFRTPQLVTWNDDSMPRILTSVDDLFDAQTNGELSIKSADFVVHLPMIVWDSGMAKQIKKPFITMPKFDANVINIDENNYTVTLQFNEIDTMNMMN